MPAAVVKPQKRVLGDSTKAHRNANITLPSPNAAKRRKLDIGSSPIKLRSSQNGVNVKLGSSQPKSQFEEEVLEKLTQDVGGLKKKNAEKDQQWERPALDDFDEKTDNLCFQQIEIEEGTLSGGKVALKLFGVTEVGHRRCGRTSTDSVYRLVIQFSCMLQTSFITYTSLLQCPLQKRTVVAFEPILNPRLANINQSSIPFRWFFGKT